MTRPEDIILHYPSDKALKKLQELRADLSQRLDGMELDTFDRRREALELQQMIKQIESYIRKLHHGQAKYYQ